uniref:Proteasome subunit alpha type n=1 Tax=Grammatophora oceanica TaxID=210454 RepID=A0A7S1VIX1_9STRA|mmetsp:Transcript_4779/g.6661  ORF Transcript_4779/g.6661 Transcript_4779/m.6661 type:complete len:248 (+) Transcript_4779:88-831(+)|eukprot:CAMPEP_0194025856 /NCGR_PEP_ID=MMETSP0009_2-20130614/143_1 /TAXON_ID=210454 /ORGANISM="Grammatophora oceanica, Strain CCMP 410" /LENGTH=247 /DNA_ID=CAMNT_0038664209 /DNA_START=88 /DNA_END=831 /DNA_ORIENTATION=-
MSYDRAITVFSPDGHLFQVEYAMEAVRRGSTVVGIKGADCVVLAVERRALAKLQDARTIRKIVSVDDRTVLAFAGLTADARVLVNRLRVEGQSYRLTMEDSPSVDYLARYLAKTQQQYTQRGGVRPFGIATLMAGIPADSECPELYQTDPAGTHTRWKAQVIGGRSSKSLREFLEKQYSPEMTEAQTVKLSIQALLEVVDSGAKTMELCVIRSGGSKHMMTEDEVDAVVKELEAEQEEKRGVAAGDD